jgi:hypothetical protein
MATDKSSAMDVVRILANLRHERDLIQQVVRKLDI